MKKTVILLILAFSAAIISCASTPKNEESAEIPQENSIENQNNNDSINSEQENSSEISEISDSEENQPEEQKFSDFENLEELLTDELNPELPELPEIQQEIEETTEEPQTITEPPVKDEPDSTGSDSQNAEIAENKTETETENSEETSTETKNPIQNDDTQNQSETETENSTENQQGKEENSEEQKEPESKTENKNIPGTVDAAPVPSRSLKAMKNQVIDITYPGKGWIYQGNIDKDGNIDNRNKNFIFCGRKLGGKDTSFSLRTRNAGTYLLHFFKNDALTESYIDDYLEVTVENKNNTSSEHIIAPDYAQIVPPKATITAEKIKEQKRAQSANAEKNSENKTDTSAEKTVKEEKILEANSENNSEQKKNSAIDTIIQTTESAPEIDSPKISAKNTSGSAENYNSASVQKNSGPSGNMTTSTETENSGDLQNLEMLSEDALLETAQKYYDEKRYPQAFIAITKFFDKATKRLDEGLYLQGRILEAKSSVQNIKNAIESYDLVVNNYPSSSLWDKANKRSIFLKRFYINIR